MTFYKIKRFFFTFFLIKAALSADLLLPHPSGPHSVGTEAIELRDPSRTMLRDSSPRRWMVQLFYPCKPHHETYAYMPGTLDKGMVGQTKIWAHSQPTAKLLLDSKFPVIIFIPGLGGERQKYTILCEALASHGYIVLSIDEPYVSSFVQFLDGSTVVLALKDAWNAPRDREYRYRYYDEAMEGTIDDIKYMLSHLDQLDDICDLDHITLMGHSFGGNVAHTLGFADDRIHAVVDIDSKITELPIFGHVGVPQNPKNKPVLFIRGMMQYQEDVGDQLIHISNSTIWSPDVEHSAFSDNGYFAAKINDFGKQSFFFTAFTYFFKRGPHWDCIDTNLGSKDVDSWFLEYTNYVVNWLNNLPYKSLNANSHKHP